MWRMSIVGSKQVSGQGSDAVHKKLEQSRVGRQEGKITISPLDVCKHLHYSSVLNTVVYT